MTKSSMTLDGVTFENGSSSTGATYVESVKSELTIRNSLLTKFNRTAITSSNSEDTLTIENCQFKEGGSMDIYGGAISVDDAPLIIKNTTFQDTYANYGGAVYVQSNTGNAKTTIIEDSKFEACRAHRGGAIYSSDILLSAKNISFSNNSVFQDSDILEESNQDE